MRPPAGSRHPFTVQTHLALADLPAPLDPDGPYTVAMVCTGNICRSAMAEVVLVDRLAAAGLLRACRPAPGADPAVPGVVVTSSGISDEEHGNPVDPRALRLLAERGYGQGGDAAALAVRRAIDTHSAHRITDAELTGSDLLLAMTVGHWRELRRRAARVGADPGRIRMFRHMDPEAPVGDGENPAPDLDVPDPWYGTMADFVATLDVVERVCDALAPRLAARR